MVVIAVELVPSDEADVNVLRLKHRLGIYAAAVILWPALVYALLREDAFRLPVCSIVTVLVMLYLAFEVSVTSCYRGGLADYDNNDSVYDRGVQVSSVAFAVATLLLSQRDSELAKLVATPVFVALLFCTSVAVPSSVARKRIGGSGHWAAMQKASVSFSAGLLCLAVARCIDEIHVS